MVVTTAAIAAYGSSFSYSSATVICLAEADADATADATTDAANDFRLCDRNFLSRNLHIFYSLLIYFDNITFGRRHHG